MSKLLINETPIMIIPSLVLKVGLNEAVVLQQVHDWLMKSSHQKEGRTWIYHTYKDWQGQLPFWSESTIKMAVKSLEEKGLLITAILNKSNLDNTKWYSINYDKLLEVEHNVAPLVEQNYEQLKLPIDSNWAMGEVLLTTPIPESTSKINIEDNIPFKEIIDYLNAETNSTYKATTEKTRELIHARWVEGFTLTDFQKVIDLKVAEWKDDPYWSKFLRPVTLFGPKFESYLNQKQITNKSDEGI